MIDTITKHNQVGEVWYKSSTKASIINITVKPFVPVKVSIPHAISLLEAQTVVEGNIDWIIKEVAKMNQVEQSFTIFKPDSTYKFQDVMIFFGRSNVSKITIVKQQQLGMIVKSPNVKFFTDAQQSHIIENIITPKMKEWCKRNVVPRALELAKIHNIKISGVTIRKSKTRWGSLGKNHNLNLSLYTATLPSDLIDYIILHELAHTKYKDHSKLYWGYLKSLAPKFKEESGRLKGYRIGII